MKIKLNQELKAVDGIETLKGDKGRPLTLHDICVGAILSPSQDDDEKKKYKRWEIFKKIRDAVDDEVFLTADEVVILKASIGKHNPPLIMGQCYDIIEDNKE